MVNALTGLGALFIGSSARTRALGAAAHVLLKPLLNRPGGRVILQNEDDRRLLEARGLLGHDRVSLIRGSGVDTRKFHPAPEPAGAPVAVLVARMLRAVASAGAPLLAWLAFWGPELFGGIFGPGWRPAGVYAAALCVPASLHLLSSWTTRTFEVCQQQRTSFRLQIASDALSVIAVLVLLLAGRPPLDAVVGYVACQVAFHVICLSLIVGLLKMGRAVLWRLLASVLGMWVAAWIAGVCVAAVLDGLAAVLVHLAVAVAIAATMLRLSAGVSWPRVTRGAG